MQLSSLSILDKMEANGQFHAPAAFLWRRNRGTHWTRAWVGPKTVLKLVHKIKSSSLTEINVGKSLPY